MSRFPLLVVSFSFLLVAHLPGQAVRPQEPSKGGPEQNLDSLRTFRKRLRSLWWHTLRRRSQKRRLSWTRMLVLADRWLPQPQVLHPYPAVRFAANHPR